MTLVLSAGYFRLKVCQKKVTIKHTFPTCTCKKLKKFLMPCKHFLAVFQHVQGVSWNSLSEIYTSLPLFTIDFDVFGIKEPVALEIENTEDPLLSKMKQIKKTSKQTKWRERLANLWS